MRSNFVNRLRSTSLPLNTVPPPSASTDYSHDHASLAARILYRSPLPSPSDLPIFILNSAAFPDAGTEVYDELLAYVLARLPGEEELLGGQGYEVVFFAGGNGGVTYTTTNIHSTDNAEGGSCNNNSSSNGKKKNSPGFAWFMRAYSVLNRATRKRLQKLWIVHEKAWVRVLVEMFATVVSPKFRKKVVHVSTLTALAIYLPIEELLIPPTAYLTDRRKSRDIHVPYATGKRAFGVRNPLPPSSSEGGSPRLPRVLRETTSFMLMEKNIKTEGIFRVSARAQTVEVLREAYDRGQKFIVWREGRTSATWPHHKEGHGDFFIRDEDLEQLEGYDTHTAAALIKLWYKELREPVFPHTSYQALKRFFVKPNTPLEAPALFQLLAPGTDYSPMNETARLILTLHLLPLLSRLAERAEDNKMTPSNLAICFAPSLLCGPDPFEDVNVSAIIRRILTAMIEHWTTDLAPSLGLTSEGFEESLKLPEKVEDREDPLEEATHERSSAQGLEGQMSGIVLLDNDKSTSSGEETEAEDEDRPPLPPRPQAVTLATDLPCGTSDSTDPIRRKPAPELRVPPRYSVIVPDQADALTRINRTRISRPRNTVEEEDEEEASVEHRTSIDTLPQYEESAAATNAESEERSMSIPRKPVAKGKKGAG
ncbi:MAG: hypothetical protein Q9217_004073 [Psora testacea]